MQLKEKVTREIKEVMRQRRKNRQMEGNKNRLLQRKGERERARENAEPKLLKMQVMVPEMVLEMAVKEEMEEMAVKEAEMKARKAEKVAMKGQPLTKAQKAVMRVTMLEGPELSKNMTVMGAITEIIHTIGMEGLLHIHMVIAIPTPMDITPMDILMAMAMDTLTITILGDIPTVTTAGVVAVPCQLGATIHITSISITHLLIGTGTLKQITIHSIIRTLITSSIHMTTELRQSAVFGAAIFTTTRSIMCIRLQMRSREDIRTQSKC